MLLCLYHIISCTDKQMHCSDFCFFNLCRFSVCVCVQAEFRTGFEELYRVMSQREEFRWMMLRIKRMADPWVAAIRSLASKQNLAKRRRKKVGQRVQW